MLTDFLDKALPQDTGNSKDRGAFLRLTVLSVPDQSPMHFPIASENILFVPLPTNPIIPYSLFLNNYFETFYCILGFYTY